ncbi:MAG TPA: nucleotidyltransferase family protein [Croceibacterium sp.]|nr:nucleotidyltransferase family protein [Croceibacterium sp.]
MTRSRPDVARVLLALAFARPSADELAGLTDADWSHLDALAGQHRLRPWLAHRWGERAPAGIPAPVLGLWGEAKREAAFAALGQRADLLEIARLLGEADIALVALKGPWLAWHAYPAAALRPMNDIDLLVGPDRALAAFALLKAAGYAQTRPFERSPEETVARDKHLPQLTSPLGTVIELHMRCWAGERPRPRDLFARARRMGGDDPLLYPAAPDMFAHLVIHAADSGRLDSGPLALVDLHMLLEREALDWPAVLGEARREGWLRHAALMLTLLDRWLRPGLLRESRCPLSVPAAVADTAEDLMLQDLAICRQAQMLADLSAAAADGRLLRGLGRKLLGRSPHGSARPGEARDFSGHGGYLPWLARRLRHGLPATFERRVRQQAAAYRAVAVWCDGAEAGR